VRMSEDAPTRIPAVFWYSCAYGVAVLATALAGVAWRAGSASIEVEGVRIDLQQALTREKEREAADQTGGPTPAQRAAWRAAHLDQWGRRIGQAGIGMGLAGANLAPDPGPAGQGKPEPGQGQGKPGIPAPSSRP
jgi:hypothetical protein